MLSIKSASYILFPLVAILVGLKNGGFKVKAYTPFMWYLLYSLANQVVMIALANNGIRNIFVSNIFNVVTTFMLASFFFRLFHKGKTHLKWYLLVCLPTLFLFIFNISDFNNDMILLDIYCKVGVSIAGCAWLVKLMLNTSISPLKIPSFWFSVALILFNLGTLIVFNSTRIWDAGASQWLIDIYGIIVNTNIFTYYILIIIGTLCISKNTTSKYSY